VLLRRAPAGLLLRPGDAVRPLIAVAAPAAVSGAFANPARRTPPVPAASRVADEADPEASCRAPPVGEEEDGGASRLDCGGAAAAVLTAVPVLPPVALDVPVADLGRCSVSLALIGDTLGISPFLAWFDNAAAAEGCCFAIGGAKVVTGELPLASRGAVGPASRFSGDPLGGCVFTSALAACGCAVRGKVCVVGPPGLRADTADTTGFMVDAGDLVEPAPPAIPPHARLALM
jgi:hypothetical protein